MINDGSPQRSKINSITVTFDGLMTLGPGAFELRRQRGRPLSVDLATGVVAGKTVAVLTFSGDHIVGGSLADGVYMLIVHSERIRDCLGQALDGDGDGLAGGNRFDAFFRRFGDGDGEVDRADYDIFRTTFEKTAADVGFLWFLDLDGDDDVDGPDNGQFNRRRSGAFPRNPRSCQ